MPNPQTPIYGLPYEDSSDEPGETLDGGSAGTRPILARAVETELARIDGDIGVVNTDIATIEARLDALEAGTSQPGWTPIQDGANTGANFDIDLTDGGRFAIGAFELVRLFLRYDLDAAGSVAAQINADTSLVYAYGIRQLDAANPAANLTAFPISPAALGIDHLSAASAAVGWRIGLGATVSSNVLMATFFHMTAATLHSFLSESTRMSTSSTTMARAAHWGYLTSALAAAPSSLRISATDGATAFANAWWWAEGYRVP